MTLFLNSSHVANLDLAKGGAEITGKYTKTFARMRGQSTPYTLFEG